ncbi:MAG TPA: phosphoglucomutase/phosphomannomutase family protein [Candidatus Saccharimonadales bacterium]|nr:phosphoglucomutase/phosphomannomutase family protein [Candidatus Saccharimonadales bacterium]
MATQIKFGTSGWRAVMADEFTVANVKRAVTGIARYVAGTGKADPKLVVGRDPRYMGETFVDIAATILESYGITPLVISEPAPTPAIAWEVIRQKGDGAINFTASHNPAEYNGIKFSTPDGAPALPEFTKQIEAAVVKADEDGGAAPEGVKKAERKAIEVKSHYLARLREIVDFKAIREGGLKVAFDPMWGASRGYSDEVLKEEGIECSVVHDARDVLFGGHAPEPDGELLDELRHNMKETGAKIGIACDGDADRFGIVDEDGTYISPNYVIALLFDYLVETRGWRNGVAKSVATTNLINAVADHHKIELYETPVGFKYIGELIKQDKIAIGGEESAGLTIRHHVPEKDGVLAGLLMCEMVAKRGKSLGAQLEELFGKVGSYYPERQNFRLTDAAKTKFTTKLGTNPTEFAGRKVSQVVRTDGLKLVLDDGSWVCYRVSGTEPVVRAYTEARSPEDLAKLSATARHWVND